MKVTTTQRSTHEGGSIHLTVSFDESELKLTPTPYGLVVSLDSCGTSAPPGAPSLPQRLLRVATPRETRVTGVTISETRAIRLTEAPTLVAPVQRAQPGVLGNDPPERSWTLAGQGAVTGPKPSTMRPPEKPFVERFPAPPMEPPNVALYQAAIDNPHPVARLHSAEYVGLTHIASIIINPVRLTGAGLLEFQPLIEVDVSYQSDTSAPAGEERQRGGPNLATVKTQRQASRLYSLATMMVVNPHDVWDYRKIIPYPILPQHVDYLIITDNQWWNAATITPTELIDDLPAAFQPLLAWKRTRGLKASLVTVTDIVNGRYGDFRRGARDLQEVIRTFLKWALDNWGISYVLLGGVVGIVPARIVAGALEGGMDVQTTNPPPKNRSYWTGSALRMNVDSPGVWWYDLTPDSTLLRPDTGEIIPYDSSGTSSATSPGWRFVTDETYSTRSTSPTKYVVVNGPPSLINASLQWLYFWNTPATDLYYASLTGPQYSLPGQHDWDLNGNGLYGQHTAATDLDGVSYNATISVGRAPVTSAFDVTNFVNKVIHYERFQAADGSPLDPLWPRRMTLLSTNWGGRFGCWASAHNPPDDNAYYHAATSPYTLVKLQDAPTDFLWRVFASVSDADVRLMPYDADAAASGRGWHYATSATDLTAPVLSFTLTFPGLLGIPSTTQTFTYPLTSNWVAVYSGAPEELAPSFYIFDRIEQDGSEHDQEQLRMQINSELPGISVADRLYEDEIDLTPVETAAAPIEHITQTRVQAALSAGPHFVSLSGHGSPDGCCGLSRDVADNLTNGAYTFIGYADSCLTNQFDGGSWPDCCSEHLINNPHGGAVAYIGSTRFSWIGIGDDFQRAFFHQMTATHELGLIFDVLRTMVTAPTGGEIYNRWTIFALNLMGDPEMPVWVPGAPYLHIRPPELVNTFVPLEVIVTEDTPGGHGPVENAAVTVFQGTESKTAYTDARGIATFTLASGVSGPVEVTASKFGAVPAQQTLQTSARRPARRNWFLIVLMLIALAVGVAALVIWALTLR